MQGRFHCAPFLFSFLSHVNITFPKNLVTLDSHYSEIPICTSVYLLRLFVTPVVSTTQGAFGATR